MRKLLESLTPFIMIGVALVALAFGLLLLAYLLAFGAILGLALFAISWVRAKFFPSKQLVKKEPNAPGRTIDHEN